MDCLLQLLGWGAIAVYNTCFDRFVGFLGRLSGFFCRVSWMVTVLNTSGFSLFAACKLPAAWPRLTVLSRAECLSLDGKQQWIKVRLA